MPTDPPPPIDATAMVDFTTQLLQATGMPPDRSRRTGEILVLADLWGAASHGLLRLPHYLRRLQAGGYNPTAELQPVTDTGPLLVLDGQGGMGHWQAWQAAEFAVDLAKDYGVGVVAVANSGHCGVLGTYGLPGLDHNVAVLAFSNGPAVMPAWGGDQPLLSTSPLAAQVGAGEQTTIVDLATTTVARGKIAALAAAEEQIPEGWALDADGQPTTDPAQALRGMLAPLGGAKGYALALVVETLTGGLVGPRLATDVADMFAPEQDAEPQGVSHLLLALDAQRLDGCGQPEQQAARLAQLFGAVRDSGGRVPGAGRLATTTVHAGDRIGVPPGLRTDLQQAAEHLGVPLPGALR